MIHIIFAVSVLLILTILTIAGVMAGKKVGKWQIKRSAQNKLEVVAVAEGTVFAVLGLLIAFTFSGAYERFEARKMHIIAEANAFETAYQRLGLLAPQTQPELRQLLREYLDSRLLIYKQIPHILNIQTYLQKSDEIKQRLWASMLTALSITNIPVTTEMVVPAINTVFDEANEGYYMTRVHSPPFVFFLLISLAVLGAFLTGYSVADKKSSRSIHVISYIVISTLTIFLIINLELPRIGIVNLAPFDKVLAEVGNQWVGTSSERSPQTM